MPLLRRDFHFAGHTFRVEGDAEPLRWLQEFVEPQFAARDTDDPDETIRFVVDARRHADLMGYGPHPDHLGRTCVTLDSGVVIGRVWRAPDGAEIVFEEPRNVFYRRRCPAPRVVEVITAHDTTAARVALMRVVREYAMLYASHAGWLILHAAAVTVGDGAFVVAGPKRAGKTTLLLHTLRTEHGAAYVSNDRVALQAGPSAVTVHGIPTIVSIRSESTAWFPGLASKLAGVHYDARSIPAGPDAAGNGAPPTSFSLAPGQLCAIFAVPSQPAAPVAALLYPEVATDRGGVTVERLVGAQALDAFRSALFRPCPTDGMFRPSPDATPRSRDGLAAHVVSRVPSFRCRLGPDAYRDGVRWLSSLRRQGQTPRG